MEQQNGKKRRAAIIGLLAVLLLGVGVFGTIAWLTASNSVTNTFTVGQLTKPDPSDPDPDKPGEELPDPGDEDGDGTEANLEGNIYEIFNPDSPVTPGSEVRKEPYIGIGKDSEDAFVYVYIENAMTTMGSEGSNVTTATAPYFTLAEGWAPVNNQAVPSTDPSAPLHSYVSGLFKWVGGTGHDSMSPAKALEGSDAAATWTGKVFDKVVSPDALGFNGFAEKPEMNVYCYLYAAINNATAAEAEANAITWATTGGLAEIIGAAE